MQRKISEKLAVSGILQRFGNAKLGEATGQPSRTIESCGPQMRGMHAARADKSYSSGTTPNNDFQKTR